MTSDTLLDGSIVLKQWRRAHRAGTDAVLLAAMVPTTVEGEIVDAGAGTGAVGLCIGVQAPGCHVTLLENDAAAAALARANLVHNGLSDRGRIVEADLYTPAARRSAGLMDGAAHLVVSNPPFFDATMVNQPKDARRARAHVLPVLAAGAEDPLQAWIRACLALLAPRGRFVMIHTPSRLATILAALESRAGEVRITPVHPYAAAPASRLLVEARKGSRAVASILPMLVLHDLGGAFTPAIAAVHRGAKLRE